jgi:hypothetical protein
VRFRTLITGSLGVRAAALALPTLVIIGVSGCQQPTNSLDGVAATTTGTVPTSSSAGRVTSASLPDLVGRGLQNAQDAGQDAGFFTLLHMML